MTKIRKLSAYSLAEVLICLAVIGILSSLGISALFYNSNNEQRRVSYKKAYSIISQAWFVMGEQNQIILRNAWNDNVANTANFTAFRTNIKVTTDCNNNNNFQCWNTGVGAEKYMDNYPTQTAPAFIDLSGMAWSMTGGATDVAAGGEILVDTNGFSGPNRFGVDRFVITPIVPNVADGINSLGIPSKINPLNDYIAPDPHCPSGNCLYSTLIQ